MPGDGLEIDTDAESQFHIEWSRVTLASIGDAVMSVDIHGRVNYLNAVAESLTGWSLEDARGRSLAEVFRIVNESTRQTVESPTVRALRDGVVVGLANHTLLISKDGTELPIDDSAAPIRNSRGEVSGVVLVFRDMSEKRKADRTLSESEARKTAMFEVALDCVVVTDHLGRILEFNAAAERTFGRLRSEVVGKELAEVIIPPAYRDMHRAGVARFVATGESTILNQRLELSALRADGSEFPVELTVTSIQPGESPIFIAYVRDISDRKRAESLFSAQKTVLEQMVMGEEIASILETLVTAVEQNGDGPLIGSVLLVDRQGRLRHGAAPNLPEAYNRAIDGISIGEGVGCCGTAAHRKQTVIVQDIATDPLWASFKDLAAEHGLCACWSTPILSSSSDVLGTFAIYYGVPREPSLRDRELVELLARTARIAIERRTSHEALVQRAAQVATLLDEAPMGVYLVDSEFRVREANPTAQLVFGTALNPERRNFDEVMHLLAPASEASAVVERFRHTLATGQPFTIREHAVTRLDTGETEYYEWHIGRIELPDGDHGVVCYFQNISDQIRARLEIEASESRLRFMAESMPQKVFTAKPNGDIVYFNPQWVDFTGLEFDRIKDWGWTEFVHPDDLSENVRVWQASIDSGDPFISEQRFRRADGEYRWHISRALPMRDDRGNIVMWVGSNTDIHEQKNSAIELERLAADLSDADRRKDEFLAMLSHELRNPLAPIRNAVHLLKPKGPAEDEESGHKMAREIIERQVKNLTKIVNDLLEVSRAVSGRIRLDLGSVDLRQVVEHALQTAGPTIKERGHIVAVNSSGAPVWVMADATRLEEVLVNLINNAAKYTPEGGVIEVDCRIKDGLAETLIRDNGVGIDKDLLPRIFDLFTQGDRTLDRSEGGLGIGLSLAHRLIEMHGGSLSACSPPPGRSRGSEFCVRLAVTERAEAVGAQGTRVASPRSRGQRVLVVDDNRDLLAVVSTILESEGFQVKGASNGPDAIAMANDWSPDLALLDIGLPGMSGFDVARSLRSDLGKGLTLIALTGYGQESDVATAREAGFDAHLTKPFDIDELLSLMSTANVG